MIEIVITSSVLIAAVLLIRFICKGKISRRLQYGLWLIVAIRLLLPFPFSIPAPMSVMNAVDLPAAEQFALKQMIEVSSPRLDSDTRLSPDSATAAVFIVLPAPELINALKCIWIGGIAVIGIWFLSVNIIFYTKLRKCRQKLDIDECRLTVYVADDIDSPCLFGLVRPAVYLPRQVSGDARKVRHAITHELCHYAQFDHIWSMVRSVYLAVYWFNPLVWIAVVCSRFDCELACDELAVRRLGDEERLAYGQTLVELVSLKASPSALVSAATTMTSGARRMKERISMVAKSPKTRKTVLLAMAVMLSVTALCTFTGSYRVHVAEQLVQSIRYENDTISFTIPADYKNTKDWNIYVYGRERMGDTDFYSSVHLFMEENVMQKWEAGRQYSIVMSGHDYQELGMDIYMRSDASVEESINLLEVARGGSRDDSQGASKPVYNTFTVNFPAYRQAERENSIPSGVNSPFQINVSMPDGWEIRTPDGENESNKNAVSFFADNFLTALDIWEGERYIGQIGYNTFEPYEGDIPAADYYKTVYAYLRLGSMYLWEPYTPVKTIEASETAVATVCYKDEKELVQNPGAAASVPFTKVPGILSYDKDLSAYIGIQFAESAVTDAQVAAIAQTIELVHR